MEEQSKENLSAWIMELRSGNEFAFSEIAHQFFPLMRSLTVSFASELQEDAMQECRLALYRSALSYDMTQAEITFGLYAKICMQNALVSFSRKKSHGDYVSLDEMQEKGTLSHYISEENWDLSRRLIEDEETASLYQRVTECLSEYEASVFRLYMRGETPKEIAQLLQVGEKSVANAISRIMAKLRHFFKA